MGQMGLSAGVINWWALLYNFSFGEFDRLYAHLKCKQNNMGHVRSAMTGQASKPFKKMTRMWAEGLKRHGLKLGIETATDVS